jgi:hypothetical protein
MLTMQKDVRILRSVGGCGYFQKLVGLLESNTLVIKGGPMIYKIGIQSFKW